MVVKPLDPSALHSPALPRDLGFETTDSLESLDGFPWQDRATEAMQFGIGIRHERYNLFAVGAPGSGLHSLVRAFLEREAFRVARGAVTSVLLEAAVEADLIALGRSGGGTHGPGRLESTTREITSRRTQSVLVLQGQLTPGQTVVTLFDGSASCKRAVAAAARLCERLGRAGAGHPRRGRAAGIGSQTAAAEILAHQPVRTWSRTLVGANLDVVLRAVHDERPALGDVGCQTRWATTWSVGSRTSSAYRCIL